MKLCGWGDNEILLSYAENGMDAFIFVLLSLIHFLYFCRPSHPPTESSTLLSSWEYMHTGECSRVPRMMERELTSSLIVLTPAILRLLLGYAQL